MNLVPSTVTISKDEYATLNLIAEAAWMLEARYPFDDDETMDPRWRHLGLWLAYWVRYR